MVKINRLKISFCDFNVAALQKIGLEQKLFEDVVAQIQDKLETQSQTEEALKNAEWTLNWIRKSEQLFQGAPCKVESLEEAEFTKQEFQQYKAVLERTGENKDYY